MPIACVNVTTPESPGMAGGGAKGRPPTCEDTTAAGSPWARYGDPAPAVGTAHLAQQLEASSLLALARTLAEHPQQRALVDQTWRPLWR